MYNFSEQKSEKRYGWVTRGWHKAKVFQMSTKNSRKGKSNQYIQAVFEIMDEDVHENILVPAFFNLFKNGKTDHKFMEMGRAAGLTGDYGSDLNLVLQVLIDRELMIYVVHRYKSGQRRERAVDFKSLLESDDIDDSGTHNHS